MFNFKEKPVQTVILIMALFVVINIFGTKAFDLLIPKQSQTIFYKMVDDAVEKSLIKHLDQIFNSDLDYPVTILVLEFGIFKTAEEVEDRVKFLKQNQWNAQVAAMKVVAKNEFAIKSLESKLYDKKFVKIIIQGFE